MNNYLETLTRLRMTLWLAETKLGISTPTADELDEMIKYYSNTEEYDFCVYLKDYKNNSLSNIAQ